MLILNIDPHIGNQTVLLSDSTMGELSGIKVPQGLPGQYVVQWTFTLQEHEHEGFIYTGALNEGQVITSFNGQDKYKLHFQNR